MRLAWALVVAACSDPETGTWCLNSGSCDSTTAECAWAIHTSIGADILHLRCDPVLHCGDALHANGGGPALSLTSADLSTLVTPIPIGPSPLTKDQIGAELGILTVTGSVEIIRAGDRPAGNMTIEGQVPLHGSFDAPYCD